MPKGQFPKKARRNPEKLKLDRIYEDKRKWFLADPANSACPVAASGLIADYEGIKRPHFRRAEQIHHKRGRVGALYLDERWWLAVSAEGHRFIHDHPSLSTERGWMLSRNILKELLALRTQNGIFLFNTEQ